MFVNSYTVRHIHIHTPRLSPSHSTHSFHIVTLTLLDSPIHNPQMHTNSHTHRSIHTHTQSTYTFTDPTLIISSYAHSHTHMYSHSHLHTLMPTHPCTLSSYPHSHTGIQTLPVSHTDSHSLLMLTLLPTCGHSHARFHTCAHSHSLSLLVLYSPTHIKQSLPGTLAH